MQQFVLRLSCGTLRCCCWRNNRRAAFWPASGPPGSAAVSGSAAVTRFLVWAFQLYVPHLAKGPRAAALACLLFLCLGRAVNPQLNVVHNICDLKHQSSYFRWDSTLTPNTCWSHELLQVLYQHERFLFYYWAINQTSESKLKGISSDLLFCLTLITPNRTFLPVFLENNWIS